MVDFSEVVQAVNGLCTSLEGLVSALDRERVAADSDGGSTEPPRECWFEHTDDSDGTVFVRPLGAEGWLVLRTVGGPSVHFDPDAINGLAQCLDGYRTDGPCPQDVDGWDCAGTRNHAGPCSENADNIGAPEPTVNVRNNCLQCGHEPHGAVGCGERLSGVAGARCTCRGGA